jgi:formylglycine-generating enzyme required for sulfatase activity
MMKTHGIAMVVLAVAAGVLFAGGAAPPAQPARRLDLDLGNGMSMKLALIPAGKFLMGSPDTERDREKDETQHEVTISKPLYVGITPVAVDQFAAFVKDSGYKTEAEKAGWSVDFGIRAGRFEFKRVKGGSWRNPNFDQKGNHPVVHVSWNDAQAFCDWLSKKTGKTVVLPTVTGRSKTSHSWALQNQPPLVGVSDTLVDSNRLNLLFKVSGVGRLSFSS